MSKRWGLYLDSSAEAYEKRLAQAVIQYETNETTGEVILIYPQVTYALDKANIRELEEPPKFVYGEAVSPCNHMELVGEILRIRWHFKKQCYFYIIKIDEKVRSKRYFDEDLVEVI